MCFPAFSTLRLNTFKFLSSLRINEVVALQRQRSTALPDAWTKQRRFWSLSLTLCPQLTFVKHLGTFMQRRKTLCEEPCGAHYRRNQQVIRGWEYTQHRPEGQCWPFTSAFRLTFAFDGVEADRSAVSPQQFAALRPRVKGEEWVISWVPLHDLTQQEHDHPLHQWLHLGKKRSGTQSFPLCAMLQCLK